MTGQRIVSLAGRAAFALLMLATSLALFVPFMPVMRGQDLLYRLTKRICETDAYVAQLPFAILHAPASDRVYDADAGQCTFHRMPASVLAVS